MTQASLRENYLFEIDQIHKVTPNQWLHMKIPVGLANFLMERSRPPPPDDPVSPTKLDEVQRQTNHSADFNQVESVPQSFFKGGENSYTEHQKNLL